MAKDAKQSSRSTSKRRLGRGLSSLIGTDPASDPPAGPTQQHDPGDYVSDHDHGASPSQAQAERGTEPDGAQGQPLQVQLDQIRPNPYQPRREFREDALAELAESIRQQGILQPLVICPDGDPQAPTPFVLIAGERRLRAAGLAGLETAPCIVRQAEARQMLEWALIENIHRADLNPLEKAQAYRDYIDRFQLSQTDAAEKLGQPRTTVANFLRVLDLCEDAQQLIAQRLLTFGHAKVLAGLAGRPELQATLARQAVAESLSVRQLEARIAAADTPPATDGDEPTGRTRRAKPAYVRDLEEQFREAIGTRVAIRPGRRKNSGKIVIEYYSLDDFDRIAEAFGLGR